MKDIWKALIIAFLLFVIPLIWNWFAKGALIHVLGGVTKEDLNPMVVTLGITHNGRKLDLALSDNEQVIVRGSNPEDPVHQWELRTKK